MSRRAVLTLLASLSLAAPARAGELYVTNTHAGTISIIDTTRDEVIGTIPLGAGVPNRIALTTDGSHAWVIHDRTRMISIVDLGSRTVLRQIKVGENPYNLAFSPDGRYCWVLDWGDVSKILVYDLARGAVESEIEVSTWPAHGLFSRDGQLFWVTSETAGNVAVVDVPARKIVKVLPSGGDAMGLALTADGRHLFVANGEGRSVSKVDTRAHTVVASVALRGIVHDVALTPDGRYLYATLRKANVVAVIRTVDLDVVAHIPQPGYPDLVAMAPDGTKAYVTNRTANVVSVISLADHREVRRITAGKGVHGMAFGPPR